MQIAQLLETRARADIITCPPDARLRDAVRMLAEHRIGAMPVMMDGRVLGIVSERDVIHCLAADGGASLDKPVSEAMTAPVISVACETSCDEALALMTARRIRHLPVVDKNEMRGFLSIGDLVAARLAEVSGEADAMRSYIRSA